MDLHAFFNKEENKQFLDIALELAARRDEMVTIQFSAIAKEIKSRYKDYEINVWDSGKGVSVRHSKFDEIKKFCFYIAAEIEKQVCILKVIWRIITQSKQKKTYPKT